MARRKRKRKGEPEGFGGDDAGPPGDTKLTPVDVQQKVFRLAFRGYREGDVDEFLDQVTETLALLHEENKRLRESLDSGTGGAPGSVSAAERQAAEIVRQAREHAARLVEDAERKVPPGEGRPAVPVSGSFLVRERAFLQRLASLVQSHARSLKDEARRAREASSSAEPVPAEAEGGRPQGREVGEDTGPEVVAPAADDVTAMPAEAPPSGEGPRADRPEEEREDQPPNREPSASLGGQPPGAPAAPTAAPSVAEAAPPPAAEPASPG
ncbi:MAG: DivIVA domain-containing protein, partial [Actinomycetota bacterium]